MLSSTKNSGDTSGTPHIKQPPQRRPCAEADEAQNGANRKGLARDEQEPPTARAEGQTLLHTG